MNDTSQIQTETRNVEQYEDEIDLMDYLLVIWKWKNVILAGTIICGLVTAIISISMPKIYSIDMVLSPGILSIGKQGKNVYLDSPQNIKALIVSGKFNNDILNYLNETKMSNIPKKVELKGAIQRNSDTIKVVYETDDIKQGMVILNHLSELLIKEYNKLVQYYKGQYDNKLSLIKHKNDNIEAAIQSCRRNMKNIETRNNELETKVGLIKNNSRNLVAEQNKFYSKIPKGTDGLQSLFYAYLIQQNIELTQNTLNQVYDYKFKREEQLQKILSLTNEKELNLNEMKILQFEKDNIQNIQIIQAPTKHPIPIKPKTKLNVMLALIAGLFVMTFSAFFLEFISKFKRSK